MQLSDFFETGKGEVKEVLLGTGPQAVTLGGERALPFHDFEGTVGAPVRLALEVFDVPPEGWPGHLADAYAGVLGDPVGWAQKSLAYGADLVSLYLAGIDGENYDPAQIALKVKQLALALGTPLIVMGVGDKDRDTQVLTEVASTCAGLNLLLGPLVKENYDEIAKAALAGGHGIVAQSPLDINLCKEMNVKLTKFFPREKIVIDPLSAAIGYGFDYSFSLMERVKQVAVLHGDEMMKMPILANVAKDCWKTKEAREDKVQGVLWEALTAFGLIMAGANLVIMRHPESLKLVRKTITSK
jgi:CO dehydrogenase/acetyl-CoA synthase delta subunit